MGVNEDIKDALDTIRTAPSPMFELSELEIQECCSCGSKSLSVTRYPAYLSRFFSGLILLHCRDCGLAWVPIPELDLDDYYTNYYAREFRKERVYTGAFFDRKNPIWARSKHNVRDRAYRHLDTIREFYPIQRILDIGCGEGFLLYEVDAQEKFAFEPDENVQKILSEEVGAELVSAMDRSEIYDVIVASHVLEHFTYDNIFAKLCEIFFSLKPGGIFFMEVPGGAAQLSLFVEGERPTNQRLEPHTLFYSSYSLGRLLRRAGFEIVRAKICPWTRKNVEKTEIDKVFGDAEQYSDGPLEVIVRKPEG